MKQTTCHFKKIIGIDPGKSGGICLIEDDKIMKAYKCPDNIHSMCLLFSDLLKDTSISSTAVYIEKVWARPSDGRVSVFTFAQNYGHWEAIIASNGIVSEYVIPSTWMKHFDVPKGLKKKDRKNHIKDLAKAVSGYGYEYDDYYSGKKYQLQGKVTLATADAIMIARYGIDKAS
tara:strand:+ start:356 stop:877 length:522 start_codon:yes stop_codon:yes gene_type:complete